MATLNRDWLKAIILLNTSGSSCTEDEQLLDNNLVKRTSSELADVCVYVYDS